MGNTANEEEIIEYVNCVHNAKKIKIIPRDKNVETRLSLGLTVHQQEDIVRSITANDYKKGPEDDKDETRDGKIWVFIKEMSVYNAEFYIKVKYKKEEKSVIALSCHFNESK